MIADVQVVNKNGNEDFIQGDRVMVMAHVKNIGDDDVSDEFEVYFEYWYRDDSPLEPVWMELGTEFVYQTIHVNGVNYYPLKGAASKC